MLKLKPTRVVAPDEVVNAVRSNYPFIVKSWLKPGESWDLNDPNWEKTTVSVTVVPKNDTTVSFASTYLRKKGMTFKMNYRELFDRIQGIKGYKPCIEPDERYYLFGGKAPKALLYNLPWPDAFEYIGDSPYVASSGVTAKAHYDFWWAFLLQVHGKKEVKLFPPSDYCYLYPQTKDVKGKPRRSLVDLENPDFEKYPLLQKTHGELAILEPGDILFMPIFWWHEVKTDSFSISFNRRIRRNCFSWGKALVQYSYTIVKARLIYDLKPLPLKLLKSLVMHTWDAFIADLKSLLTKSSKLP